MKRQLMFVLFLMLGVGMLATSSAAAQNLRVTISPTARVEYGVFNQVQSGLLRQADWDDRRCDGDHDRDGRGCWNRDHDGDRYYRGNGYYGNQYYGNSYGQQGGWYDRKGNFYPNGANGYYDKHGKWHYFHGHRYRD